LSLVSALTSFPFPAIISVDFEAALSVAFASLLDFPSSPGAGVPADSSVVMPARSRALHLVLIPSLFFTDFCSVGLPVGDGFLVFFLFGFSSWVSSSESSYRSFWKQKEEYYQNEIIREGNYKSAYQIQGYENSYQNTRESLSMIHIHDVNILLFSQSTECDIKDDAMLTGLVSMRSLLKH
jgi:hypothetical protein